MLGLAAFLVLRPHLQLTHVLLFRNWGGTSTGAHSWVNLCVKIDILACPWPAVGWEVEPGAGPSA